MKDRETSSSQYNNNKNSSNNSKERRVPSEIGGGAIDDTLMILVHLKESTVLAPRFPKLCNFCQKEKEKKHICMLITGLEEENPIAIWEPIFKPKSVHLVVGFDEAATKASPKLMPEARRNLCRGASHSEERERRLR